MFLKIIAFLIIFYYIFKVIGRFLFPFLIKKGVENMQKKQEQEFKRYQEEAVKREGEVRVETKRTSQKSTKPDDTEGEYVDFEEVE